MKLQTPTYENAPIFFEYAQEKTGMRRKKGINYTTFGAPMVGRQHSSPSYRYGFNGMEKVDEMHNNSGDSYDFGARIYDARLGRWLSTDPLESTYPNVSTYAHAINNPICFKDPDGNIVIISYKTIDANGNTVPAQYQYDSGLPVPDNEFVRQSIEALDNISSVASVDGHEATSQFPSPSYMLSNLSADPNVTVNITESTTGNSAWQGDAPSTVNVGWNPNMGKVCAGFDPATGVNVITNYVDASSGLNHELKHAYNRLYFPAIYEFNHTHKSSVDPEVASFPNDEEMFTTLITDNDYNVAMGYGRRTGYGISRYPTNSVSSNIPITSGGQNITTGTEIELNSNGNTYQWDLNSGNEDGNEPQSNDGGPSFD